ncbi:MAG TPA: hypothetical protein V6C97_26975 [Oculatellaceae cyanobacterium]
MIPEFNLPGFGSKTKAECNTVTYADYCPDCHQVEPKFYHCFNWECPECLPWTSSRAARRVAERLSGCHAALHAAGGSPGNINHVMLSVPASEYDGFDLDKMWGKAKDYAKQIGFSGGAIAFHPCRIKGGRAGEKRILRAMKIQGLKGGSWVGVHADVLGLDDWRDYAVFSPHFHIVGYFKLKEQSDEFYHRTGWTYKNITWSKRHRAEGHKDIRRIFAYVLTHHAVVPGKQNVRYFGNISYNKMFTKTWKETELKACPDCSEQMYRIPVKSADEVKKIRSGVCRVELDESHKMSRLITVRHFYIVRARSKVTCIGRLSFLRMHPSGLPGSGLDRAGWRACG